MIKTFGDGEWNGADDAAVSVEEADTYVNPIIPGRGYHVVVSYTIGAVRCRAWLASFPDRGTADWYAGHVSIEGWA